MSLNKSQQSKWNFIVNVFSTVSRLSQDPTVVHKEMESWITDFEKECNGHAKVIIKLGENPSIYFLDSSKDSLKLVRDATPSTVLRAKVFGVSLASTIQYKESYLHKNDTLVNALRALADKIEGMPMELAEQTESMDVLEFLGGKASDSDEEGDHSTLSNAGEQSDDANEEKPKQEAELQAAGAEEATSSDDLDTEDGRLVIQLVPGEIE